MNDSPAPRLRPGQRPSLRKPPGQPAESPGRQRMVGYVRRSRASRNGEPEGAGLPAQRKALEAACEARGWALVTVLEDDDRSARRGADRPGLEAAMALCDAGGADGLVCARLDRLSRSTVDFGLILERAQRGGWAVVLLDLGVDMTTPVGELMANVLVSVAQFERRVIAERTKAALAVKREAGIIPGPSPSPLAPETAAQLREWEAAGYSRAEMARRLNEAGVKRPRGGRWESTIVGRELRRLREPPA